MAYKKKHRRFTDWEYKSSRLIKEEVGNQIQFKRIIYYQRFDRVLNVIENKEEILLTPAKSCSAVDIYSAERSEWFAFKEIERKLNQKALKEYYSNT